MDIITYALSKKNTGGSSGATEEQATQIQTNTNNISELKEDISSLSKEIADLNVGFLGVSILSFPRLEGETDDSPRIQRAFDSLPSKEDDADAYYKGLVVYFPAGEYEIATTVTGINVGIIGDAGTIFKGMGTGYMFDISFDGELGFTHVSGGAEIYQWRNFPIEKCIFNGNGLMNGVKHSGGHNITLRDCIFCDTVDYGYYIASGSKYFLDHVTFRGISTDTSLNKVACYLGGSDHNLRNIIIPNYTKGFVVSAACTFFDQCHMWLNHNDRIASSVMFEVNVGKCVITNTYVDTVKIGIKMNSNDMLTINNINGYNNTTFSLTGAVYVYTVTGAKLFVSGVQINDTRSAKFINIEEDSCPENIKLIGIRGDCSNIYETYGKSSSGSNDTNVPCTGITLDLPSLTFTDTTKQTLTAQVTPSDTTDTVTWESSDASIATVSNGVVTPKGNGNCTITVTCGGYSTTCEVNISGVDFSVETWDYEWDASVDTEMPSFMTVPSGWGLNEEGYIYNISDSTNQKMTFPNFETGGNQTIEVEFGMNSNMTETYQPSGFQIALLDGNGNGHKLISNGCTQVLVKGTEYTYDTEANMIYKARIEVTNGYYNFYIDDNLIAENIAGYADKYIGQYIQLNSNCSYVKAIRHKIS